MKKLIECVPNFSEGRDLSVIERITAEISAVEGVSLLDVDPGASTNRTVVTFVGEPEPVIEAAFRAIRKAAELIDMSKQKGAHPRMGATDVCPLVPVSNVTDEEAIEYAKKLGERVGTELNFPVYLYEKAATKPERQNLAIVRDGEYEGLAKKLADPEWAPDFGPAEFKAKEGATVIGVRDFLIAYNINLNTQSVRRANSVAFDIREKGRVKREGDVPWGEIIRDSEGQAIKVPGSCKGVKAIGWYVDEYGIAQVSMNITDMQATPLHKAFQESADSAHRRHMRVTGSEIVGLVPKKALIDAGKFFLERQNRSAGVSEEALIKMAIHTMGLDELAPFDPQEKIIEYRIQTGEAPLTGMDLKAFNDELASDSPAPGGGSVAALCGALGASLGTMVANLSAGKAGWDEKVPFFSEWAEKGQALKAQLLNLVEEDTAAFNAVIAARRLPKNTPAEKEKRNQAITQANYNAAATPLKVMQTAFETYHLLRAMTEKGNPSSVSDAGVGALCTHACVHGAYLNVRINLGEIKEEADRLELEQSATAVLKESGVQQELILSKVEELL